MPPLRRRIDLRRILLGDPLLKGAALAVATLLWVSALWIIPPPDVSVAFDGRIPVERGALPEGYAIRGVLGEVSVRVRGPADVVAALAQDHFRATVDVAQMAPGPGLQEAPVRVAITDQRVRVLEVTPAAIPIRFERLTSRDIAVQARFGNEPPSGFQPGEATFRPQQVTVTGPESLVASVAAVLATVRFGDEPVDLAQSVQPVPVDAAGARVVGVEVDPVALQVSVPIVTTATTRTVPVLWRLTGQAATGYWISEVITDPVAVTVSGDRSVVEQIEQIETEPVDVGELSSTRTMIAPLIVPEGASLLGEPTARVTVSVVALPGTRPYPSVAVSIVGLEPGLTASVDGSGTVAVVLAGTMPVLSALGSDVVTATVNASGRGAGSHVLEVQLQLPPETALASLLPARVTVIIRTAE